MKHTLSAIMVALVALLSANPANARFFDTSAPADLMTLGVRLGVNTSNRNLNKDVFDIWNCNSWGTGVDVGVVADLHFRNWFSVQPGLFYESRSGKYSYINVAGYAADQSRVILTQFGKDRSYNFVVPILASAHFNLSDDIRWNIDFGPYLQIVLKNTVNGEFEVPVYQSEGGLPVGYVETASTKCDFGFKMGSSLKILGHYLVGIHYEAGVLKPWKDGDLGGRRKAWVFSIGYDF